MRRRHVIGVAGLGVLLLLGLRPAPASADQLSEGLRHLRQARAALDRAWDDKGGHKKTAMKRIDEAVDQVQAEMRGSRGEHHERRRDEGHRVDEHRRDEGHRLDERGKDRRVDEHHDNRRRSDESDQDNRRRFDEGDHDNRRRD
jgi:hypothetical protein